MDTDDVHFLNALSAVKISSFRFKIMKMRRRRVSMKKLSILARHRGLRCVGGWDGCIIASSAQPK
jgi:hypothetical protein